MKEKEEATSVFRWRRRKTSDATVVQEVVRVENKGTGSGGV